MLNYDKESLAAATRATAMPPLQAMEPWEIDLWQAHAGTWTSKYTVRDAEGNVVDAYSAVNEISIDLQANTYAQRNTYTRSEGGEDKVETRAYTAFFDGKVMLISGCVLWGTAVASHDASRRVIALNFFNTAAHPMGEGFETFELITLGANPVNRARCMQHWKVSTCDKEMHTLAHPDLASGVRKGVVRQRIRERNACPTFPLLASATRSGSLLTARASGRMGLSRRYAPSSESGG